jgi:phosphatidylserine/phosphatidylglycerophosphate/cardiolipin synthase-like enzyme
LKGRDLSIEQWFLTAPERGNPSTRIDLRRDPPTAWSLGNEVTPLVHGAVYFHALSAAVELAGAGDLVLFTDWRGDPDEVVDDTGIAVSELLSAAARRGVIVKGLIWRSHLDRLRFSAKENRHLGEAIERAGGECLLDMRVRLGGSHHQKLCVVRYQEHPERDVAFVGGIDLCHSRRDDQRHAGDPQRQPMAKVYGERPPWHDIQLAIRGPAVADFETVFRERWEDPTPPTRDPLRRLADLVRGDDDTPRPLPPQAADPPVAGSHAVQVLRTYPQRRRGYAFAPDGEHSVARGYEKAVTRARDLIYIEDQYLWSADVGEVFARALRDQPGLRLIAVVPPFPDQDGAISEPPSLVGREAALRAMCTAGGDRVAVYGIENEAGVPIYVHAKVCIIDDEWASVGSDNFNRRSWTYDSELSAAVLDEARALADDGGFAQRLRLTLACEHLGRDPLDTAGLRDASEAYETFARSAAALEAWHESGQRGPRPPGRLRPVVKRPVGRGTRIWATPTYLRLYDPDGRDRASRRQGRY